MLDRGHYRMSPTSLIVGTQLFALGTTTTERNFPPIWPDFTVNGDENEAGGIPYASDHDHDPLRYSDSVDHITVGANGSYTPEHDWFGETLGPVVVNDGTDSVTVTGTLISNVRRRFRPGRGPQVAAQTTDRGVATAANIARAGSRAAIRVSAQVIHATTLPGAHATDLKGTAKDETKTNNY